MFSFVKGLRKLLCFVKVFFQLNPAIKIIIHVATSMNIILDVPFTEDLEMRIFFPVNLYSDSDVLLWT